MQKSSKPYFSGCFHFPQGKFGLRSPWTQEIKSLAASPHYTNCANELISSVGENQISKIEENGIVLDKNKLIHL